MAQTLNLANLEAKTEGQARRRKSDGNIGERVGQIGLEIAEITGLVDDLVQLGSEQIGQLRAVVGAAKTTSGSNAELEASMTDAAGTVQNARVILNESSEIIADTLAGTAEKMQTLAKGVMSTTGSINQVRETISKVIKNSAAIQAIAFETRLIALNAGVEAARAGAAGHGFSVISNAIRSLADQVGNFSNQNQSNLAELHKLLEGLEKTTCANAATAQSALEDSHKATSTTQKLQSLVASVEELTGKIDAMTTPVRRNIESGLQVRDNLKSLVTITKEAEQKLASARTRAQTILEIGEDFMVFIAETGVDTPDTAILEICRETAGRISETFEKAIVTGAIRIEDLFDHDYRPIPDTDPEQVLTRFTRFTDEVLPAIQEPVLKRDPRIVFCAAVDVNGYLPTHNKVYSQPQGDDPVWNAANCRNRRIFNDRTGAAAGRNKRKFLLQTYRRDMGNGNYVLMKDASAPITVAGRHWGGLRIAFKA